MSWTSLLQVTQNLPVCLNLQIRHLSRMFFLLLCQRQHMLLVELCHLSPPLVYSLGVHTTTEKCSRVMVRATT